MKEQKEENNLAIQDVVSKTEEFIAKNQRIIIIVVAAILVIVLGYFGIKKLHLEPKEREAAEMLFGAENRFLEGNYELALKGDDKFIGLIDVVDGYSSTKQGNLAKYYAGIASLKTGQFDDAVSYLKSYKGKDTFTKALAVMALGDAYIELGDMSNAISKYKKASENTNNSIVAPSAMFKLGLAYYTDNNMTSAEETFKKLKANYPYAVEAREIDKYIALVETAK